MVLLLVLVTFIAVTLSPGRVLLERFYAEEAGTGATAQPAATEKPGADKEESDMDKAIKAAEEASKKAGEASELMKKISKELSKELASG
jgi:hypothetical protein